MKILVVGGSGATGEQLVEQLLTMDQYVKVLVRATSIIPDRWNTHDRVSIIKASITEMSVEELAEHVKDCVAVASCLGHNMTWKGIYGQPRKLVADSVRLLAHAIEVNARPIKLVWMNTAGNKNLGETISPGESWLTGLIRLLLPPHKDNEAAAAYLRDEIGQTNTCIEWVVVRPDSLIDEDRVTEYHAYPSPVRSALFNPGKTSRINVGHFMAKLLVENSLWNRRKGQMPVIYNVLS